MKSRPKDFNTSKGDPQSASAKAEQAEKDNATAAGEGAAANDPPEKPCDDEETMPIEEGFSIVP